MLRNATRLLVALVLALLGLSALPPVPLTSTASAAGFITFEDGADGQPIRSTIPGLRFTTTAGYDWVYGDWRTGSYNGRYPAGAYTSNGNFFAWLGPNQGAGRIDFTGEVGASYLSVWVSTAEQVWLTGYDDAGRPVDQSPIVGPNVGTGRTVELRVQAPGRSMRYAIITGRANFWLLDDLATDADGVPDARAPLVLIPGTMGTRLLNSGGEIWPDGARLLESQFDEHLDVLQLAADGASPLYADSEAYASVTTGDIVRAEGYAGLLEHLKLRGYRECERPAAVCPDGTLFVFPYDWRKDIGAASEQLDGYVRQIRAATGARRVNILAHSMGGLVARAYIADAGRADSVGTLVTLGTPYLGAPLAFTAVRTGECIIKVLDERLCLTDARRIKQITQNFAGLYQLMPSAAYHQVYPDGFLSLRYDDDGDGAPDGRLAAGQVTELLARRHNSGLAWQAAELHGRLDGYTGGTNGVRVFAFVGYGLATHGTLSEYRVFAPRVGSYVRHDILPTTGDGTVPLHSADLGNDGRVDLGGPVDFLYVRGKHGDLPNIRTVHRLAVDLLEVVGERPGGAPAELAAAHPAPGEGIAGVLAYGARLQAADEPAIGDEPALLRGTQIVLYDAGAVEVRGEGGATLSISVDGAVVGAMEGVTATRLGETTALFLAEAGSYTVVAEALPGRALDWRERQVADDAVVASAYYDDVIRSGTVSREVVGGGAPGGLLAVDADGDGAAEGESEPLAVLGAAESADVTLPEAAIALDGERAGRGWYVGRVEVTLTAEDSDGGSGVARVDYSLDGGATFLPYEGAFTVDAGAVGVIVARATDRAGNEQYPLTAERVGPEQVRLPLVRR